MTVDIVGVVNSFFGALREELIARMPHAQSSSVPISPSDVRDVQARISKGWGPTKTLAQRNGAAVNIVYNTSDQHRRVLIQPQLTDAQKVQWNPGQLRAIVQHAVDSGQTTRTIEILPWGTAIAVPAGVVNVQLQLTDNTDPGPQFAVPAEIGCSVSVAYGVPERHLVCRSNAQTAGDITSVTVPDFAERMRILVSGDSNTILVSSTALNWSMSLNSIGLGGLQRDLWLAAQPVRVQWTGGLTGLVSFEWECAF